MESNCTRINILKDVINDNIQTILSNPCSDNKNIALSAANLAAETNNIDFIISIMKKSPIIATAVVFVMSFWSAYKEKALPDLVKARCCAEHNLIKFCTPYLLCESSDNTDFIGEIEIELGLVSPWTYEKVNQFAGIVWWMRKCVRECEMEMSK